MTKVPVRNAVGVIQEEATCGAAVDERALSSNGGFDVAVAAGRQTHWREGRGDHGK